jgi:hypothetical protein
LKLEWVSPLLNGAIRGRLATAHLDYQKDGVVCKMVIPMAAANVAE